MQDCLRQKGVARNELFFSCAWFALFLLKISSKLGMKNKQVYFVLHSVCIIFVFQES